MERTAMNPRATATTEPAMSTTMSSTMSAVDFDHGVVGRDFLRGDSTGIDQGECIGTLASYRR
jgi:hypothetical protein